MTSITPPPPSFLSHKTFPCTFFSSMCFCTTPSFPLFSDCASIVGFSRVFSIRISSSLLLFFCGKFSSLFSLCRLTVFLPPARRRCNLPRTRKTSIVLLPMGAASPSFPPFCVCREAWKTVFSTKPTSFPLPPPFRRKNAFPPFSDPCLFSYSSFRGERFRARPPYDLCSREKGLLPPLSLRPYYASATKLSTSA